MKVGVACICVLRQLEEVLVWVANKYFDLVISNNVIQLYY